MQVGTLKQIWRYPVKSMMGECLDGVDVLKRGIPGDRGWAIRDEVRGGIRGARIIPQLMQFKARYLGNPTIDNVGPAEITFPDGEKITSDSLDASRQLSQALNHEVTIWPLLPEDNVDHYRRSPPQHADFEKESRMLLGLEPDEPLPDFTGIPPELFKFETLPGTYFDAFPLLVMTDSSLARLQALAPESIIDVRRFRPNFVIASEIGEGFIETGWTGKKLVIGNATLQITIGCARCVMTTIGFDNLPKDPKIMRTLVREASHTLGVYALVETPGVVSIGDKVEILD